MDDIQSFVSRSNVAHYLARLRSGELQAGSRDTVMRLLMQEEERLGRDQELLDMIEARLEEGRRFIATVQDLVAVSPRNSAQHAKAEELLATLRNLQSVLEERHAKLRAALE
jgi:hypothetical protein